MALRIFRVLTGSVLQAAVVGWRAEAKTDQKLNKLLQFQRNIHKMIIINYSHNYIRNNYFLSEKYAQITSECSECLENSFE